MTTLRELLNVDYPVIQAPMAGVQDSALTIAVSKAGGLGSLPCGMLTGEKILEEVASIRAATDRTFNLNFFCHIKPVEESVTVPVGALANCGSAPFQP